MKRWMFLGADGAEYSPRGVRQGAVEPDTGNLQVLGTLEGESLVEVWEAFLASPTGEDIKAEGWEEVYAVLLGEPEKSLFVHQVSPP